MLPESKTMIRGLSCSALYGHCLVNVGVAWRYRPPLSQTGLGLSPVLPLPMRPQVSLPEPQILHLPKGGF